MAGRVRHIPVSKKKSCVTKKRSFPETPIKKQWQHLIIFFFPKPLVFVINTYYALKPTGIFEVGAASVGNQMELAD